MIKFGETQSNLTSFLSVRLPKHVYDKIAELSLARNMKTSDVVREMIYSQTLPLIFRDVLCSFPFDLAENRTEFIVGLYGYLDTLRIFDNSMKQTSKEVKERADIIMSLIDKLQREIPHG